jgi:hypothetical protein
MPSAPTTIIPAPSVTAPDAPEVIIDLPSGDAPDDPGVIVPLPSGDAPMPGVIVPWPAGGQIDISSVSTPEVNGRYTNLYRDAATGDGFYTRDADGLTEMIYPEGDIGIPVSGDGYALIPGFTESFEQLWVLKYSDDWITGGGDQLAFSEEFALGSPVFPQDVETWTGISDLVVVAVSFTPPSTIIPAPSSSSPTAPGTIL